MRDITLIMAYYENRGMLQRHLHHWRQYQKKVRKHLSVIIVDDGSPKAPAALHSESPVPISIYRMGVDIRWNQDACRNLGAFEANTEWLIFTDMDHMVPADTMMAAMTTKLDPSTAYRFTRVSAPDMTPYKPHPNSWMMTKVLHPGYDERLAGWYGTDGDFLDRVGAVAPIVQFEYPLIRVPREVVADSSTTTLTRKSPEDFKQICELRRKYKNTPPLTLSFPWEKVL